MKSKLIALALAVYAGVAASQTNRYEAESTVVDENSVQKVTDSKASGGYYINTLQAACCKSQNPPKKSSRR